MGLETMSPETRARWMAARVSHGAYVGGKETPEHYVWRSMLQRVGTEHWRDVKVCERWRVYKNFIADMRARPTPRHSLDRYPNPFGDYEKSNCRWATQAQQMRNLRKTQFYTDGDRVGTLGEWAAWLGLSVPLARYRWQSWGTFEQGKTFRVRSQNGEWCAAPAPRPHKPNPNSRLYTDGTRTGRLLDWANWLGLSPAVLCYRWKRWGTFEKGKEYAPAGKL